MKKNAIVTGAIGGIGTEICKQLFDKGFNLVATYQPKNIEKAECWQDKMKSSGFDVYIAPVDVASYESCQNLYEQVSDKFGAVSVLVNNAGVTDDATIKKMQPQQWDFVLRTNLDSVFNMSKVTFEDMCQLGGGRIINISSINGHKGQFGQANYSAAKAGIYGFTKSLALEGARKGVTVNSISPGYTETNMLSGVPDKVLEKIIQDIPVGRLGKPQEIANAVCFLVGANSDFITGSDIAINGGQYM